MSGCARPGRFGLAASVLDATHMDVNMLMRPSLCRWHAGGRVPDAQCQFAARCIGLVTGLMVESGAGVLPAARALLCRGADPNVTNDEGVTALSVAVTKGHTDMVDLLLASGASVNVHTRDGQSVTQAAQWAGHDAVCTLLKAAGGSLDAPLDATGGADVSMVPDLLAATPKHGDWHVRRIRNLAAQSPALAANAAVVWSMRCKRACKRLLSSVAACNFASRP